MSNLDYSIFPAPLTAILDITCELKEDANGNVIGIENKGSGNDFEFVNRFPGSAAATDVTLAKGVAARFGTSGDQMLWMPEDEAVDWANDTGAIAIVGCVKRSVMGANEAIFGLSASSGNNRLLTGWNGDAWLSYAVASGTANTSSPGPVADDYLMFAVTIHRNGAFYQYYKDSQGNDFRVQSTPRGLIAAVLGYSIGAAHSGSLATMVNGLQNTDILFLGVHLDRTNTQSDAQLGNDWNEEWYAALEAFCTRAIGLVDNDTKLEALTTAQKRAATGFDHELLKRRFTTDKLKRNFYNESLEDNIPAVPAYTGRSRGQVMTDLAPGYGYNEVSYGNASASDLNLPPIPFSFFGTRKRSQVITKPSTNQLWELTNLIPNSKMKALSGEAAGATTPPTGPIVNPTNFEFNETHAIFFHNELKKLWADQGVFTMLLMGFTWTSAGNGNGECLLSIAEDNDNRVLVQKGSGNNYFGLYDYLEGKSDYLLQSTAVPATKVNMVITMKRVGDGNTVIGAQYSNGVYHELTTVSEDTGGDDTLPYFVLGLYYQAAGGTSTFGIEGTLEGLGLSKLGLTQAGVASLLAWADSYVE